MTIGDAPGSMFPNDSYSADEGRNSQPVEPTFHGSFEPATFDATRAWFSVEVEDDEGVRSCGGTFTSVDSAGDAEDWIKARACERGFERVIWDTRDPTRGE